MEGMILAGIMLALAFGTLKYLLYNDGKEENIDKNKKWIDDYMEDHHA